MMNRKGQSNASQQSHFNPAHDCDSKFNCFFVKFDRNNLTNQSLLETHRNVGSMGVCHLQFSSRR